MASFGAYNQLDKDTGYFIILLSNQIRPELMDLINEINNELDEYSPKVRIWTKSRYNAECS